MLHDPQLSTKKEYMHPLCNLPFTSGIPDFGSDGVRCFTRDDVRERVDGFVGEDSILTELLA